MQHLCVGFLILDLQVQILPDAGGGFIPRTNSWLCLHVSFWGISDDCILQINGSHGRKVMFITSFKCLLFCCHKILHRPWCVSYPSFQLHYQFIFVLFLMRLQIFGIFVSLVFLGQAFTIMLVYVWSRRNPNVRMNFFGLLNFQAPFLPWVLMGFSLLLGNSIIVDLLGTNLLLP